MTNESLERERWNAELSLRETELKLRMDAARLEENKFEYEKQYRQQELELREKDYLLRSSELQSKEDEVRRQHWFSPLFLAILAAAIAASGNAIVSYLNNSSANKLETLKTESTFRLEESKAEAARILEGIKTGNTEKAAENLEFLVQANLISEHKRAAIMVYLLARKRGQGPSLPIISQEREERSKEFISNNELLARRMRGSIDMWLLEREAERSGRLKDLKSVIGTKYGQEAAATATLWLQSASVAQLQDIMTLLRIELQDEKEIEDFRKERSKEFITQVGRAKALQDPLMTWIRKGGNFDKAKVMIKTWFENLPDPLVKTIEVESIRATATKHKVATEPLMDAGKPAPAKFAGFIDSLGSAENTMSFCVDILRFKMLEEAEKLVPSQ